MHPSTVTLRPKVRRPMAWILRNARPARSSPSHRRDAHERRSPDHLAMTGAPVQQWVALFEERHGSESWTRTSDQSVNSRPLYQLSYLGIEARESAVRVRGCQARPASLQARGESPLDFRMR